MSMLSAQRDRLRAIADRLFNMDCHDYASEVRDAADTIWQLRNDCVDLRMENEKLRELVLILLTCASDLDECDKCPINGGTGVWDFEDFCDGLLDRVHELGIKVKS